MSDSSGYIYDKDGINAEKLAWIQDLKEVRRGRIDEYAKQFKGAEFHEGRPWNVPCDVALPCATQNELDEDKWRRWLALMGVLQTERGTPDVGTCPGN